MFYVITRSKGKVTFNNINDMFMYINMSPDVVEGFAGY